MSKGQEESNIQARNQDLERAKQKIKKCRLTGKHR
jgi:hypothetical protein